jgi:hypothetical protein
MKTWQFGLVVFGLTALSMLFMPSEASDAMGERWRRLTGDPGQACFDYQRTLLKDPYSARFDSYSVNPASENQVTVKYHAKNSYGSYGGDEALCSVWSGRVSEEGTQTLRENLVLGEKIRKMKVANECIGRKNSLMRLGNYDEGDRTQCVP